MQKTRLGISPGLLAAAIYLLGLFSGFWVAVFLAGYVLLLEENRWLKISAVKAVSLMAFFSFLTVILNLIPNFLGVINDFANMFQVSLAFGPVNSFFYAILGIVDIVEKILFLILGFKALQQGTIRLPVVDQLIARHMPMN